MVWGGGLLDRLGASTGITNYTIRGNMFSLTGLILASLAKEKMGSGQYRKARRRLMKTYTEEAIVKLQTKHGGATDSDKIEKAIKKMMVEFKRDHQIYIKAFMDVIKQLVKVFEVAEMEDRQIITFYPQLQLDLEAFIRAHPDNKIFPEKITEAFKNKLDNVLVNLIATLQHEIELLAKEASPQSGASFPGWAKMRAHFASTKARGETRQLGKDVKKYQQLKLAIETQFSGATPTGIQQNFLSLLLHYAILCERVFGSTKKIKSDMIKILEYMDKDIVIVERQISYFLMFMKSDPRVKGEITSIKNDFDIQYKKVKDYLVYEETKVMDLKTKVAALESGDIPDKIADVLTMDRDVAEATSDLIFHHRTAHLVHREHFIPDHPLNGLVR
ncbi:MAG: hypothetical protein ABIH82_06445 [Candidatus Woesearchaeota archaeon]